MKLRGLRIRGIGRFAGEAALPIAELGDAELVGVVGGNGEGKTTLLECLPGALYRTTPSRGPIAGLASDKDSFVEVEVETDRVYTARLVIDGVSKTSKTEAYLIADGAPLSDGKAKTFDAAVLEHFPSRDLVLASTFAAQTREGSFLDAPASRRKELFAELLGLGRLQELSDAAGERLREVHTETLSLEGSAETSRNQAAQVGELEASLAEASERLAGAGRAREDLEAQASKAARLVEAWRARAADLEKSVALAEARRLESNRHVDHIKVDIAKSRNALAAVLQRAESIAAKLVEQPKVEAQAAKRDEIAEKVKHAETQLERIRESHRGHSEKVHAWRRNVDAAKAQHRELCAKLDASVERVQRAERSVSLLGDVPCKGEGAFAACRFLQDARQSREALAGLTGQNAGLAAELAQVDGRLKALQDEDPAGTELEDTRPYDELLDDLREDQARAIAAHARLDGFAELAWQLGDVNEKEDALRGELAAARDALADAERILARAVEGETSVRDALVRHRGEEPRADFATELARLRWGETDAAAAVARVDERLKSAQAAAAMLAETEAQLEGLRAHLGDWSHLRKALGRQGVQALEIDASGPEVSGLCNELLHACYGSRFSVSLETAALKADGSGTKEIFDLRVLDTERGTDGSASQLSGGEKVLASEALALAIAIYNSRRSSIPMLDLFRDECAGALSSSNAVRYVEMLRRALRLGGFHRCYFVAHQPHLWDLADARILVEDGAARLADAADITIRARESIGEAA